MKNSVTKDFVIYDNLSLDVIPEQEQLYVDCYQCFGWIFTGSSDNDKNKDYFINNHNINKTNLVNIKFKRDKRIKNKSELLILQKNMESALKNINKLSKEPEQFSAICSVSIGVVGLLFFIFAILSYTASTPIYILSVLNGIIGIVGFALAFFMNSKIKNKKQEKNEVLIEEQYDLVYEFCEKASKLTN